MVGIVADGTTAGDPLLRLRLVTPRIDDTGRRLAQIQPFSLRIERTAGFVRQGLEGLESRNNERGLHISSCHHRIVIITALQQPHSLNLGAQARNTGI